MFKKTFILMIFFLEIIQNTCFSQVFTDVAERYSVADIQPADGAMWLDFDNDGDLDILVSRDNTDNQSLLYRNDGDSFVDVADSVGFGSGHPTSHLTISGGDYDNDGDIDLLLYSGGWVLLKNDINDTGFFIDQGGYYPTASFIDYDNDGDLDIYATRQAGENRLYQNNNDDTFSEITGALGLNDARSSRTSVWGDFDSDGDMDVYVVNIRGERGSLYRNDVNTTNSFTDITDIMGVGNAGGGYGSGACWADYDNDGDLDLYLITLGENRLYRNDLNTLEVFTEVSNSLGLTGNDLSTDGHWGDYDNDGDLDLYVINSGTNRLYRNEIFQENGFIESGEMANVANGYSGGSWGDFDNDGDLDFYLASPNKNRLYQNNGNNNNWLNIKAVGRQSNRSAIGTTIRIVTGETTQTRYVQSNSGFGSQNSLAVEFGLGNATTIDTVVIKWPSGLVQTKTNVGVNQFLTIIESSSYINLMTSIINAFRRDTVTVPLYVVFPVDCTFSSVEMGFTYDHQGLNFIEILTDATLTGSANWEYEINETDSLYIFAAAGSQSIKDEGILCQLKFVTQDDVSGLLPVSAEYVFFNPGNVPVKTTSGGVRIFPTLFGDIDLNGQVQVFDASLILKHIVGSVELDIFKLANADVSLDSSVSALDASLILKNVVHQIDSLPYKPLLPASGIISMPDKEIYNDENIEIPLLLSIVENIYSFEGKIIFNPDHLSYVDIIWSEQFSDFTVETFIKNGEIFFAGAATNPHHQQGVFAMVTMRVNEGAGIDSTAITLAQLRWNEEAVLNNSASCSLVILTGIQTDAVNLPEENILYQNFPNPFNPSTKIMYSISKPGFVTLKIYDSLGNEIQTLVNKYQYPNIYSIHFDSHKFSSGFYFCVLQVDNITKTKKMVLLR